MYARPRGQVRPQLPYRGVKRLRCKLRRAIFFAHFVGALVPADQVQQSTMLDRYSLGSTGRTGRVDHICQVAGLDRWRKIVFTLADYLASLVVQADHLRRGFRQHMQKALLRQQHGCSSIFQHEGQPLRRVGRIERHIGAARLEDGKKAHDHLYGALHANPHEDLRTDTAFP